jgi:hypothetical protein
MNKPSSPLYQPLRLEARRDLGAGWRVYADVPERISCVEFAMKPGWKPVLETKAVMAYAPWVGPFAPQEWEKMVGRTLTEMVDLWNKAHASHPSTP